MGSLFMHVFAPITHIFFITFGFLYSFFLSSFALFSFLSFCFSISLVCHFFSSSSSHCARLWPFTLPVVPGF